MIAFTKKQNRQSHDSHQQQFLVMLPRIRRRAMVAFGHLGPEARDELAAEVVANAYCAFVRLAERGKADIAYAVPLAIFAIRQVREGRRVGSKRNIRDVTSPYAQHKKGITVESLDQGGNDEPDWREIVVEDRHAGPDEVASTRIDFSEWLRSMPQRTRRIATTLATGETTGDVAQRFQVSSSRISQLRRELMQSWDQFQSENASSRQRSAAV